MILNATYVAHSEAPLWANVRAVGGFHEGNGKGGGNHFYVAEVGLGVLTVKNHGNCKPRQFRFEVGCLRDRYQAENEIKGEQNEIKEGTSARLHRGPP